jgi:hypothetical protein
VVTAPGKSGNKTLKGSPRWQARNEIAQAKEQTAQHKLATCKTKSAKKTQQPSRVGV